MRKWLDSSTSRPVGRFMKGEGAEEAGSGLGTGGAGERRAVMACMLLLVSDGRESIAMRLRTRGMTRRG